MEESFGPPALVCTQWADGARMDTHLRTKMKNVGPVNEFRRAKSQSRQSPSPPTKDAAVYLTENWLTGTTNKIVFQDTWAKDKNLQEPFRSNPTGRSPEEKPVS